jgi:hypothetical protein
VVLAAVSARNSIAQYCSGGPSSSADSNLGLSTFVGENTFTYAAPCPGPIGVHDQTSTVLVITEGRGYSSSIINYSSCGPYYSAVGSAWIDFNFNQIFDQSEVIHTFDGAPPALIPVSFVVPRGMNGLTRMRVVMREGGILPLNACAPFTWGGAVDFGVRIEPGFCTEGGPTSPDDAHLNGFSLVGAGSTLTYNRACPGHVGVEDRTDLSTTLERGFGHRATLDVSTCSLQIASAVTVWIDYNQNQLFDRPDEVAVEYRGMPSVTPFALTVPHTAMLGTTRMRVMVKEGGALPLDSCESFTYGAVVDFHVTITDPSDGAPTLTDTDSLLTRVERLVEEAA